MAAHIALDPGGDLYAARVEELVVLASALNKLGK